MEEEEDLARFLASDPQKNEDGTIWQQYAKTVSCPLLLFLLDQESIHLAHHSDLRSQHPSRSVAGYCEHHRLRKSQYFDFKITEIKRAAKGRPVVYKHPKIVVVEVETEDPEEEEVGDFGPPL